MRLARAASPVASGRTTATAAAIAQPTKEDAPGELLARLDRGPNEELRIVLNSYNGHPYVALEHWTLQQNHTKPTRMKAFTVKVRETAALGRLLLEVAAKYPAVQQRAPQTSHRD